MKNAVTKQDYDNQSVERQAKLMVRGLAGVNPTGRVEKGWGSGLEWVRCRRG